MIEQQNNITQEDIIDWYMDDALAENDTTKTVNDFAQKHQFDESQFFEHFKDFVDLEKAIFAIFGTKTIELLNASEVFEINDTKTQLLSFYFTFFELLSANRSYVLFRLKENKNKLQSLQYLTELREIFLQFAKHLNIQPIDFKHDKLNSVQRKSIEEALWVQLLVTIKFWLNDTSEAFETTDVFIEKSIKAQFDVLDTETLKSVLDFAKFVWKEK